MKRYLISAIIILAVLAVTWAVFAQEGERPRGAGRGAFLPPEEQQKALEAIEQQVAKLKAVAKAPGLPEGKSFSDLTEEERAKFKERMTERQGAIRTIIAQIARLQGQPQPAEGEQFIIVNTADLKAVQALAEKEKAKETSDRIAALLQPRRGTGRPAGQPGERGTRQKPPEKPGAGTP